LWTNNKYSSELNIRRLYTDGSLVCSCIIHKRKYGVQLNTVITYHTVLHPAVLFTTI
jgi:hypothetical protein